MAGDNSKQVQMYHGVSNVGNVIPIIFMGHISKWGELLLSDSLLCFSQHKQLCHDANDIDTVLSTMIVISCNNLVRLHIKYRLVVID